MRQIEISSSASWCATSVARWGASPFCLKPRRPPLTRLIRVHYDQFDGLLAACHCETTTRKASATEQHSIAMSSFCASRNSAGPA